MGDEREPRRRATHRGLRQQRPDLEASLAAEHEIESGGVARAVELGVVDEIITPDRTRSAVSLSLEDKKKILGLNAAKLYDLEVPAKAGFQVAVPA